MWFLSKRDPGQSTALQFQLLVCKLSLLNIHQTCILCIYECHFVCPGFYSNESTLSVERFLSLYMKGIKHKVDDRLSDMAEVQCLCVMEGLYGGEDALSRFI